MNQEQIEEVRLTVVKNLMPVFGTDMRNMLLAASCVVNYIQTGASPYVKPEPVLGNNPIADALERIGGGFKRRSGVRKVRSDKGKPRKRSVAALPLPRSVTKHAERAAVGKLSPKRGRTRKAKP